MKKIAFFDFDGTITRNDTFILFGIHCFGKSGFIKHIVKTSLWLTLWKLGIISSSKAKEKLFSSMFKNFDYDEFKHLCCSFADCIENNLKSKSMELLNYHQKEGHKVCVVSASVEEWIIPWAKTHGITDVIATKVERPNDGDKLSGRFLTPNCLGEEKVKRIKEYYPDFESMESWAYGDSDSDMPMLNISTHPIRV